MFIAKFLDQKQGEAKVIDRQQVLRDHLNEWLKVRPTAADLAERGILERAERLHAAREVLQELLQKRVQALEEEQVRIPPGSFAYTDRVRELLNEGVEDFEFLEPDLLQDRLERLRARKAELLQRHDAASKEWAKAAEDTWSAALSSALPEVTARAAHALSLLEAHKAASGGSLAGVFQELADFQKLLARRKCLADIVQMVQKTNLVREAALSYTRAADFPLGLLEELPLLCAALPSKSRAVGLRRVQSVLVSLRSALARELAAALRETGRWPLEPSHASQAAAPPDPTTAMKPLRLCIDLHRAEIVHREICKLQSLDGKEDQSPDDLGWAAAALTAPLVAKFRHLFCRPESKLCQMDKPEWAFRYLTELATDHARELTLWLDSVTPTAEEQNRLQLLDLPSRTVLALASEARLFVRVRMKVLGEDEARPTLLHTMQHLVRFHGDIAALGGAAASAAAFADFTTNRRLEHEAGSPSKRSAGSLRSSRLSAALENLRQGAALVAGVEEEEEEAPDQPKKINLVGAGLMAGLSQLRRGAQVAAQVGAGAATAAAAAAAAAAAQAAQRAPGLDRVGRPREGRAKDVRFRILSGLQHFGLEDLISAAGPTGFLDVWADADGDFIIEKLCEASAPGGRGWRARPLRHTLTEETMDEGGPEAAEFANLLIDLFDKARERAECLASPEARCAYCARALEPGLRAALAAMRGRWNSLADPLNEIKQAAFVIETLEEICQFLDSFSLALHMVNAVDESMTLRLNVIEKLAEAVKEALEAEEDLGWRLTQLRQRLRPDNFAAIQQRAGLTE